MAKRMRTDDIKKRLKEGRGIGVGQEYKPWIRIQDVPSKGRVTRLKGIKTCRQHEFLSDMERNYFYLLEYSDDVVDIREQFPLLPIEDTISISEELGIEHPRNPKTGEFIVMTTDFLITVCRNNENSTLARTIKSKNDLLDRRILEKFEIERVYWKKREVDWGIVTEEEIDKLMANNISIVHGYKNIVNTGFFKDIDHIDIKDFIYEFIRRIIDDKRSVRSICLEFDTDMMLENGSGISIYKYLIINKIIQIDLSNRIDISKNIPIIRINEEELNKLEAI